MKTLRYRSNGPDVYMLEELLVQLGYDVHISTYFGKDTHDAVLDFQKKNALVIDGIVGLKTWSKLIAKKENLTKFNKKFLSEQNLIDFSEKFEVPLAAVKAVNEVESSGKGFLLDGRPRILFEGHVFWRQLKKRGIDPEPLQNEYTKNVLYKSWTKKYYEGGEQEYDRIEKAAGMSDIDAVHDAAYASASYGAFQIMGFHFSILGYPNVDSFVADMYTHESAHLDAFGEFCRANNLIRHMQQQNWTKFALGYNGPQQAKNNYDGKLKKAFEKYSR
ncbi:MAG: N-acetylmuramidase family protein [Marinirhabdus sp.]|nr:N-acetylmuramidase family protein [Marinirhabdus sp.]